MIQVKNLGKTYNKGKSNEYTALKDVSFQVQDGEMVAIMGKSGAGKSTLLHILSCIDGCDRGTVIFNGVTLNGLSEKRQAEFRNLQIGVVLQDFALVPDYTVIENVMIPLLFTKDGHKKRKEKARKALQSVGIASLEKKRADQLSGGQKQRVAIARALVNGPECILADEPTGALDSGNAKELLKLLSDLNKQGKTILIVTHDPAIANATQRIIELSDGSIIRDEAVASQMEST